MVVWCGVGDLEILDDVEKVADNELNAVSDTVDLSVVSGHGDLGWIDVNRNHYIMSTWVSE